MKKLLSLVLAVSMVFVLAACGNKPAATTGAAAVKIGIIAPETGNVSQYGIATRNGVLLAIEDINAKGGLLGSPIEHIVYDDQGDVTESVNAFLRLTQKDEVDAIVGAVTTQPTIAVAQEAANVGIPMITASATGEKVTQVGANVFRACFIDPYQGELMANYAVDKLGAKTAAVLYDVGDDYSSGIAVAFEEAAKGLGLEVTNSEAYTSGTVDFNSSLTLIKASNPDVVMVPCYYGDAGKIITQARSLGITAKFLGSDGWDGVENQVDASKADDLKDSYYCSQYSRQSDDPAVQNFIARYQEKYGMQENMFAVLGYDAMMMMAAAIEKAGTTDDAAVVAAMTSLEHAGLTGTTVFDSERNPKREAYITVFENGESKFLETYNF